MSHVHTVGGDLLHFDVHQLGIGQYADVNHRQLTRVAAENWACIRKPIPHHHGVRASLERLRMKGEQRADADESRHRPRLNELRRMEDRAR